MKSKKHRDTELQVSSLPPNSQPAQNSLVHAIQKERREEPSSTADSASSTTVREDDREYGDEIDQAIDQKIAAARSKLSSLDCLFCTTASSSLDSNLSHMSVARSFFIPDAEYLIDITGLLSYLGEKI